MKRVYFKTYGVEQGYHKGKLRWYVVTDGQKAMDLHYEKKEFALKKAEQFAKSLWNNFTDFQGNTVTFNIKRG